MEKSAVLVHIAEKFSWQVENIATECLAFILNKSHTARDAFLEYFEYPKEIGFVFDKKGVSVTPQEAEQKEARPDLRIKNASGGTLLIESKFWAGLTEAQPVKYLEEILGKNKSMLAFLAPNKRIPTLWPELLRRCKEAGYIFEEIKIKNDYLAAKIDNKSWLTVTSWNSILYYILRSVEAAHEMDIAADLKQLLGLCDRQDEEAFLPLAPEELSINIPRRILQFNSIVNKVTDKLINEKFGSTEGYRATRAENWFGRYISISGYACLISCNFDYWAKYAETPIWLLIQEIVGKDWVYTQSLREALMYLSIETPSRLFKGEIGKKEAAAIPLFMPFGKEEGEVIDSIIRQIKDIMSNLPKKNLNILHT